MGLEPLGHSTKLKKSWHKQLYIETSHNRAAANHTDWLPSSFPFNPNIVNLRLCPCKLLEKKSLSHSHSMSSFLLGLLTSQALKSPSKYLLCEIWNIISQEKSCKRYIFLCCIKVNVVATAGLCYHVDIVPLNEVIRQACCSTSDCTVHLK